MTTAGLRYAVAGSGLMYREKLFQSLLTIYPPGCHFSIMSDNVRSNLASPPWLSVMGGAAFPQLLQGAVAVAQCSLLAISHADREGSTDPTNET